MTDNDWTPSQVSGLRALWPTGLSLAEIGTKIGKSKNAVGTKAHRLGLVSRPSPIRPGTAKAKPLPRKGPLRDTLPPLAKLWRPDE